MQRKKDPQSAKGDEILRQMREDTSSKQHLDRQKIRAEIAIRKQWKRETGSISNPCAFTRQEETGFVSRRSPVLAARADALRAARMAGA